MRRGRWVAGTVLVGCAVAVGWYWLYPLLHLAVTNCPLDRQISSLGDQRRLFALAARCDDDTKRLALVDRLTDPFRLKKIALSRPRWVFQPMGSMIWPKDVRRAAVGKIRDQQVLKELVLREHDDVEVKIAAAARLEDQDTLEHLASMGRLALSEFALSRIAEPERIASILASRPGEFGGPTDAERSFIDKVGREDLLERIAIEVESFRVGSLAVERIRDGDRLVRTATEAGHEMVRRKAREILRARHDKAAAEAARRVIDELAPGRDVAEMDDPAALADLVIKLSGIFGRPWTTFSCLRDDVCRKALERLIVLGDREGLAAVVKDATGYEVQKRALLRHLGVDLLTEIESYLVKVRIPAEASADAPGQSGRVLEDVRRDIAAHALIDRAKRGNETRDEVATVVRELLRLRSDEYIGLLRSLLSRHADKRLMDFYLNNSPETDGIARDYAKYHNWVILEQRVPR